MIEKKLAEYIRHNDYAGYQSSRFPEIADYEELIFKNENFADVDWSNFPSSMNVFDNCNLDGLILSPGQPIRIENSSAREMNINGITAIIHAKNSDFTGLKYDNNTVLANSSDPSNIPSTFEHCVFDDEAKNYFQKQGVVFKD